MYCNVRGVKSKINSLTEILHDHDPHLYLLTETQLRSNTGVKIDGYTFYGRKREGKNGGGVGILVRTDVINKTTPHISDRNIEMMWISLRAKSDRPLIFGVYYGQQESASKNEIELEMFLLTEEINEMRNEGEILVAMDGNAKIGLLGEQQSRNGKLLMQVFTNTDLIILNNSNICNGKVTRTGTNKDEERSAIDFVVASPEMSNWVSKMTIDEDGIFKPKGKNATDHNAIYLDLNIKNMDKTKVVRKTDWNLRASNEKWALFANELEARTERAQHLLTDVGKPFKMRYANWFSELNSAAMKTIGKTTFKEGGKAKFSEEIKELRNTKKKIRTDIKNAVTYTNRQSHLKRYKAVQDDISVKINKEKKEIMKQKLQKIATDKTKTTFWKEKKKLSRDPVLEALTIKDEKGLRQFHPDSVKQHTALYYKNLYSEKPFPFRPYHQEVDLAMSLYEADREHEDNVYNLLPTAAEVSEAINNKTNGKSTTDIKNEMLKRPGDKMTNFLYPLVKQIWEEETIPESWNTGHITSIWKGKGDKEKLENHRGITTSSAIGSIIEMILDNRIEAHIPFTQAQGGSQRGASTCDHLLLIRCAIDIAKSQKRPLFLTFYDVSKAYDNAVNADMLKIIWERGLRGKAWRILKNMNTSLKAKIKTKHGLTNEIEMEIGGRQGSRVTGRMFAKMVDLLAEQAIEMEAGFRIFEDLIIPLLLWVDDVVSFAEGESEQWSVLTQIDQFAMNHKLRWGREKCQVMRVGKHKTDGNNDWKIGDMPITETESYKYLGDVITNDGKNASNIKNRKDKAISTTIAIKTIATNDIFRDIETSVIMELHETTTLTALLTNSESWTLSKSEKDELERAEIQSIKLLFDLPSHTPTPALIFTFGLLYTSLRAEQRQLIYLWKVSQRTLNHWTKIAIKQVMTKNIGWGKQINDSLKKHGLPSDLNKIERMSKGEWGRKVKEAIEKSNKNRLLEELHKTESGIRRRKTKTASIVDCIEDQNYQRKPQPEILLCTKRETKTIVISRFGMLECGKNLKGTIGETCRDCCLLDDESHRLNHCIKFRNINNYDCTEKVSFELIHSRDPDVLRKIIPEIAKIWNLCNGNGTINC